MTEVETKDEVVVKKTNRGNGNLVARKIVYFIAGLVEVLLACRLILKLLGANPQGMFVTLIYSITQTLKMPFAGIFRPAVTQGIETESILDPSTIIAMIVYALIAWGIIKLILIGKSPRNTETTETKVIK